MQLRVRCLGKYVALLLALLCACGKPASEQTAGITDVDRSSGAPTASQEESTPDYDVFRVEAAYDFLQTRAGIMAEDVQPGWPFTVDDGYGDDPSAEVGHAVLTFVKTNGALTEAEYRTWADQVFRATAAVSDDGCNLVGYEFAGEGVDALSAVTLDDALAGWLPGWAFRKGGTMLAVYVSMEDSVKVTLDLGTGMQARDSAAAEEAPDGRCRVCGAPLVAGAEQCVQCGTQVTWAP